MASIIKVDTIQDQDGNNIISEAANTITIGALGDTITIPSGATLANSGIITGFESTGIDDNATSTAITINSSEQVEFTAGTVSLPSISTTGDTNTGIFFPAADTIAFSEGGVERMRIDSAGNVGIGTSAPLAPLMVLTNNPTDDSALRVAVFGLSNVNQGQLEIKSGRDDGSLLGRYSSIQAWSNQLASPRNLILEPEGGNVGIGTTTPAYPLSVVSDALIAASITCTGATPNLGLDISKEQDSGDLGHWDALQINGNDNISYESRIKFVFDSISGGSIIAGFRESGSGTQLRFYTTTEEVATEKMRITSAGNVGIGTSSPSNVLHIVSTNATAILQRTTAVGNNSGLSTFDFKNSDSTVSAISNFNKSGSTISTGVDGYEFRLTNHGDGYTSFFNDGSERMRITSAGNVGIGTTAPDAKLSVSEAGAGAFTVIKAKNGTVAVDTGASIELSGFYKAGKIAGTNDNAGTSYAGALRFYTNSNSTNDFVQRMIINSSGNVGIGTSSPSQKLDINGNCNISNGSTLYWNGGDVGITNSGTNIVFKTFLPGNFGERMRITSAGDVGIGTSSPSEKLDVTGNVNILGSAANKALTLNVSAAGGTVLRLNTFQDNANNRNWSFRNRYDNFGMLQLNRSTTQTGDSLTQVLTFTKDGNATFTGSVSKASGSFKIDHPLENKKDTHNLVHSFVESPQANNLYRGKLNLINGTATVNLDTVSGMTEGTFILLNRDIHCFTSNESGWTPVKGYVSGNILTISAQDNNCNDTISWLVISERQDKHMYDTDWTDENGKVIVEPLKQSWEKLNSENNQPQ
jgi:hypothetical protein